MVGNEVPEPPMSPYLAGRGPLPRPSGEPALAPAVVLDVAIAFPADGGEAEIELLHVVIGPERRGVAVHDDAAALQNVAVIGIAQRDVGVLLGEQEGHAGILVEAAH